MLILLEPHETTPWICELTYPDQAAAPAVAVLLLLGKWAGKITILLRITPTPGVAGAGPGREVVGSALLS